MSNIKNWLIVAVVIVIAALGGGYYWNQYGGSSDSGQTNNKTTTTENSTKSEFKITVKVNDGTNSVTYDEIADTEGKTALAVTQKVADVKTSGEGEMAFVTTINDRMADSAKKEFWEFLVNGKQAQVGAGSYTVQNGDTLEWRISTF